MRRWRPTIAQSIYSPCCRRRAGRPARGHRLRCLAHGSGRPRLHRRRGIQHLRAREAAARGAVFATGGSDRPQPLCADGGHDQLPADDADYGYLRHERAGGTRRRRTVLGGRLLVGDAANRAGASSDVPADPAEATALAAYYGQFRRALRAGVLVRTSPPTALPIVNGGARGYQCLLRSSPPTSLIGPKAAVGRLLMVG